MKHTECGGIESRPLQNKLVTLCSRKISLTIDGTPMTVDEGTTIMEACGIGDQHPAALTIRPEPEGLLPRVRGRGQGDGLLHDLLQPEGVGGHGGADQLARHPPGPPRHRRTAAGQPPQGLPDLRARRQLRTAEPGLLDGRAGTALRGPPQGNADRPVEPLRRPRRPEVRALRPLRPRLRRDPGRPQPQPAGPRLRDRRLPGPRGEDGRIGLHPVRAVHQRLPHRGLPGEAQRRRRVGRHRRSGNARRRADGPLDPRGHRRGLRPAGRHALHRQDGHRPAAAGLRRRLRHRLRRRPDDHRGGPRVPHPAQGRPAADDHLLLAGLDQLHGAVLSRADPARLDLPLADGHDVGPDQDLLRQEEGHRPEEDLRRGRDALRGQEVRGPPAGAFHRAGAAVDRKRAGSRATPGERTGDERCSLPTPC